MTFQKKALPVAAWQWTGENGESAPAWVTNIIGFPLGTQVEPGNWLVLAHGVLSQWTPEQFANEFEEVISADVP